MLLVWIDALLEWGKFVGYHWYIRVKSFVAKVLALLSITLVLLWVAVFLYGGFYYSYMPTVEHGRDVNLHFRADCDATMGTLCSFPKANLSLLTDSQREIFMKGQPYVILVELHMPESPVNQHIGMFMVVMKVHSHNGHVVQTGHRAGLMEYKSTLYQVAETLLFLPLYLIGHSSQQQRLTLELFDDFLDDPFWPAHWATVEVQSKNIQIYSVSLKIHAKFTGLRYLLFHWPVLSAVAGVASNLFFLSLLATMSWYRFVWNKDPDSQVPAIEPGHMDQRRRIARALLQRERAQGTQASAASGYPSSSMAVGTGPAYFVQGPQGPSPQDEEGDSSEGSTEDMPVSDLVDSAVFEEIGSHEQNVAAVMRHRQPHPHQS